MGNKDTAPTFSESTGSGSAATDWTYTLLSSGNDKIPDVLYGRLVADDTDDVKVQVDKWIAYEKTPEHGGAWYPKALTIASDQGSNPSDKEYAQQVEAALRAGTYTSVDGDYQGEGTATADKIRSGLEDGRTWLAYFGHGSGTSWGSTNDNFDVSTVETLTSGAKLPILVDVACENASWVELSKCFGKAWVTQKNGGAVAFLGGSVSISWNPPAVMSVGIAKAHFEKPVHSLGGSWIAGQLYLVQQRGTGDDVVDNLKWYNLLGDPSLLVRTRTPISYEVKHLIQASRSRVDVAVTAVDDSGKGVAGLTASLMSPSGESLAVGTTDTSGQATLTASGMSQLEADTKLTVSGYNAETKQIVVQ